MEMNSCMNTNKTVKGMKKNNQPQKTYKIVELLQISVGRLLYIVIKVTKKCSFLCAQQYVTVCTAKCD